MKIIILILILLLHVGTLSIVSADELTKTNFYYDIQWGHIIVGNITVQQEKKNSGIKLRVKSQSEGALSILYDYQSDLIASSYKEGKVWKGNSYMVNSFFGSERYHSKVFWDKKTGKLDFDIKPPLDLEKVYDVPKLSLNNVVDPVTAMLKVLEKINRKESCEDKLGIFDGRRRYNLSTKELKKEYLINENKEEQEVLTETEKELVKESDNKDWENIDKENTDENNDDDTGDSSGNND